MSIVEARKHLKKNLNNWKKLKKDNGYMPEIMEEINTDYEAIETLLTAYEEEKEDHETDNLEFIDTINAQKEVINKWYKTVKELKTDLEKEKKKNKELEKENKKLNILRLELLISQFPDTTETYKKYKKELDETISNLKEE